MKYCNYCGSILEDGAARCPICNEPAPQAALIQAPVTTGTIRSFYTESGNEETSAGNRKAEKSGHRKISRKENQKVSRKESRKEGRNESRKTAQEKKTAGQKKGLQKYLFFPLLLTGMLIAALAIDMSGKEKTEKQGDETEIVRDNLDFAKKVANEANSSGAKTAEDTNWKPSDEKGDGLNPESSGSASLGEAALPEISDPGSGLETKLETPGVIRTETGGGTYSLSAPALDTSGDDGGMESTYTGGAFAPDSKITDTGIQGIDETGGFGAADKIDEAQDISEEVTFEQPTEAK